MTVNLSSQTQIFLGKKLRTYREDLGMSQEDVANGAKISVTYYAGIERGQENPTIAVLEQICQVLKTDSQKILPF